MPETAYDWFVLVCLCVTLPLGAIMAVFAWVMVIRLLIDLIKYGW